MAAEEISTRTACFQLPPSRRAAFLLAIVPALMAGLPLRTAQADRPAPLIERSYAALPEAIASFGAAVAGDWLYVYSGHVGKTHAHSHDNLSAAFRRLNLADGKHWEQLPSGQRLQSNSLVAAGDVLYRIGGLTAHNASGEPAQMESVATCARYHPSTRTWENIPSLPTPRSSHDSVVLGDRIFVAGGWNLQDNTDEAVWQDSLLALDLKDVSAGWKTVAKQPFQRRAVTLAARDGKVWVLGGLLPDASFSHSVDIYDPETEQWSLGPELPGRDENGFAASAFGVADDLVIGGRDGVVRRLKKGSRTWQPVARLAIPRFFHRLVPRSDDEVLIVGGAGASGHLSSIESVSLAGDAKTVRIRPAEIPAPSEFAAVQPIAGSRGKIYAAARLPESEQTASTNAGQASAGWTHVACIDFETQLPAWQQELPVPLANFAALPRKTAGKQTLTVVGTPHQGEADRAGTLVAWSLELNKMRWRKLRVDWPPGQLLAATTGDDRLALLLAADSEGSLATESAAAKLLQYDPQRRALHAEPLAIPPRPTSAAIADGVLYTVHQPTVGDEHFYRAIDPASGEIESLSAPQYRIVRPQLAALGSQVALVGESSQRSGELQILTLDKQRKSWVPEFSGPTFGQGPLSVLAWQDGLMLVRSTDQGTLRFLFVDVPSATVEQE